MESQIERSTERHYLTLQEAATRLSVSEATLRTWVRNDGLPTLRIGPQTIRVVAEELDTWVDQRAAATGGSRK